MCMLKQSKQESIISIKRASKNVKRARTASYRPARQTPQKRNTKINNELILFTKKNPKKTDPVQYKDKVKQTKGQHNDTHVGVSVNGPVQKRNAKVVKSCTSVHKN